FLSAFDAELVPAAPGDVRGRVLVEQRVEERDPGAADRGRAVDERHLADGSGAFVEVDLRADDVAAGRRTEVGDAARLERQLEVADDDRLLRQAERARRVNHAVGTPAVRGREYLLGRDVRKVLLAPRRREL